MTTLWCPECGSEYVDGMTRCPDCDVALVLQMPSATRMSAVEPNLDAEADLVEIARLPLFDAEFIAAQLRSMGYPVAVFGVGTAGALSAIQHTEGSRVMVRRSDSFAAIQLLEQLDDVADGDPISDDELARQAEAAIVDDDPPDHAVV